MHKFLNISLGWLLCISASLTYANPALSHLLKTCHAPNGPQSQDVQIEYINFNGQPKNVSVILPKEAVASTVASINEATQKDGLRIAAIRPTSQPFPSTEEELATLLDQNVSFFAICENKNKNTLTFFINPVQNPTITNQPDCEEDNCTIAVQPKTGALYLNRSRTFVGKLDIALSTFIKAGWTRYDEGATSLFWGTLMFNVQE